MPDLDLHDILSKLDDKLDSIQISTTETKTLMTTLIAPPDGRIPKLERDVQSLNETKWKVLGAGGVLWAIVEYVMHGRH